jgi:hypothetical protein
MYVLSIIVAFAASSQMKSATITVEVMNLKPIVRILGDSSGQKCDMEFWKIQVKSDLNVKKRFSGDFTALISFTIVLLIY